MTTATFDTLQFVKTLKDADFSDKQAKAIFSEAQPRTFDAGLFSSLPIRFGQSGIAELYSAKTRENPNPASRNQKDCPNVCGWGPA
uniref:Uncharacterized protein n=1 Tax=Candidatus Kentrum sp. FW TaxID=2126338 RepID=A0A450SKZ2_9GAMM|nr:MAG: hypothetical protein BECKFW1821A_GA0114235_104617 [Candidatus Kentron sp. FW]VFJ68694.1 MAG: hypothetical protein BECKFW1821B_GA0114236_11495 [Candidatus Kentron sp. FW]